MTNEPPAHKWMTAAPQAQRDTPTQPDINLYAIANTKTALCCQCAREQRKRKPCEFLSEISDGLCEKCGAGVVVGQMM